VWRLHVASFSVLFAGTSTGEVDTSCAHSGESACGVSAIVTPQSPVSETEPFAKKASGFVIRNEVAEAGYVHIDRGACQRVF
jgi:hypothetical protein